MAQTLELQTAMQEIMDANQAKMLAKMDTNQAKTNAEMKAM
jgi:hypothetical protein